MHSSFWLDLVGVGVTQRWVDANGILTRVLETGSQNPRLLILIHGIGSHAEAYSRNIGVLGQHFHTYSIDMVGHGYTDKPMISYEVEDYVEHLRAFMDAEGIERASISGESLGGWTAARFAMKYPDRVDRLILTATGGTTFDLEVMERIKTLTLEAVKNPSWETLKKRIEWLMRDPATVTDDLIALRLAVYQQENFVEVTERILCLQDPEIRRRNLIHSQDWQSIRHQTLVIWGTDDPTGPDTIGRDIASLIPNGEFALMEGCGHWPQFEDPETFNRLHLEFLQ